MKIILFLLFITNICLSQTKIGERLKETSNQRRLTKISRNTWHFRPTKIGKLQTYKKEDRQLFKRTVTNNRKLREREKSRLNRNRNRNRVRGSDVFHKKKY